MAYEDDILIDETALDVECLDQSRRLRDYCKITAAARRTMNLAKENLEFVSATLERAIRLKPDDYGVTPGARGITEDSIKAAVKVHPEYQMASRAYIDADYEHEVAKGTVKAFDDRKGELENLVRLHGQSYFAGPAVPRDLPAERARRDREAQRKVRVTTGPAIRVEGDHVVTGLPSPSPSKPRMRRRS